MDERRRVVLKIILVNRRDIRILFGITFANQWGHFTDHWMSPIIHSYLDWIDYPKGDHVLEGHEGPVTYAVVSSDGCYLFTASGMGSIIKWCLKSNAMVDGWQAHDGAVSDLAYHCSGSLASGSNDCSIRIWNPHLLVLVQTLEEHVNGVRSVEYNQRGDRIISTSVECTMCIWSVKSGECLKTVRNESNFMTSALFIGDVILVGSFPYSLQIRDSSDGSIQRSIVFEDQSFAYYSNCDASLIARFWEDGFDVFKWPEMTLFRRRFDSRSIMSCFHPNHPNVIAVIDEDEEHADKGLQFIVILDIRNRKRIRTLNGHTGFICDLCFTPDGQRIISGSWDQTTIVWDVSDLVIEE